MKRSTLVILSLLVISVSLPAIYGQKKASDETPSLLYRVTGNGITKPSYIFGTFHAICPTEMVPFASLDTYLDQTDQLMMEIDMDDPAEMGQMGRSVLIGGGKTLKDYLTAEQFAKVDAMVQDLLGQSAENLKVVKPAMLTVLALTSPKAIGCTPTVYDLSLMQNAVAKKKPVVGLETVASQIQVLDSRPIEKQAKDLYEVADNPDKSIGEMKKLMAVYKTRDLEKLFEMTQSQSTSDKDFHRKLLDERNIAWIPKLEVAFKERPTFVAVGAGHLGGKSGVLKLLRAKGFRVEPVKL